MCTTGPDRGFERLITSSWLSLRGQPFFTRRSIRRASSRGIRKERVPTPEVIDTNMLAGIQSTGIYRSAFGVTLDQTMQGDAVRRRWNRFMFNAAMQSHSPEGQTTPVTVPSEHRR